MYSHVWRTTVLRRIASAAIAGAALLAAFGCAGGGNDTNVSAGTADKHQIAPAAEGDASSRRRVGTPDRHLPGCAVRRARRLAGARPRRRPHDVRAVRRPRGLPRAPGRRHGLPGRDHSAEPMQCWSSRPRAATVAAVMRRLPAPTSRIDRRWLRGAGREDGAAVSEVAADVPSAGVSVTLTYLDSDATAQQILQSFRAAS